MLEVVANRDVWRLNLELLPPATLTDMSGLWKKKFYSFVLIKSLYSLIVLIFRVLKSYRKNRKSQKYSQTNCNNIASKSFNYRKKNRIHWSRSLSHLTCVTIIAKCLRCATIAIPGRNKQTSSLVVSLSCTVSRYQVAAWLEDRKGPFAASWSRYLDK